MWPWRNRIVPQGMLCQVVEQQADQLPYIIENGSIEELLNGFETILQALMALPWNLMKLKKFG